MATHKDELPSTMRDEALEWRIRIDADDLDANERLLFDTWLQADPRHEQAFDQATTVWDAFATLDATKVDPDYFRLSAVDRMRQSLAQVSLPSLGGWQRAPIAAGVAATAAICVAILALTIAQGDVTQQSQVAATHFYTSELGETEAIILSDGSAITLGPASEITVSMSTVARDVELLKGAAVFDVKRDEHRPFTVTAGNFSAHVLGTVFDVRNNGGIVRLSVSEGVVEASHPIMIDKEPMQLITRRELHAGEEITANEHNGLSQKRAFNADRFAAWRDNRLRYNGATLQELIADANRYSDIPIVIDAKGEEVSDMRVTFGYDGKDVEGMLAVLPTMFPVTLDRSDETVITVRAKE